MYFTLEIFARNIFRFHFFLTFSHFISALIFTRARRSPSVLKLSRVSAEGTKKPIGLKIFGSERRKREKAHLLKIIESERRKCEEALQS